MGLLAPSNFLAAPPSSFLSLLFIPLLAGLFAVDGVSVLAFVSCFLLDFGLYLLGTE